MTKHAFEDIKFIFKKGRTINTNSQFKVFSRSELTAYSVLIRNCSPIPLHWMNLNLNRPIF